MDLSYRNYVNPTPCIIAYGQKKFVQSLPLLYGLFPLHPQSSPLFLFLPQVCSPVCLIHSLMWSWILVKIECYFVVCMCSSFTLMVLCYKSCSVPYFFSLCTMFLRSMPVALYIASSLLWMQPPSYSYPFYQLQSTQNSTGMVILVPVLHVSVRECLRLYTQERIAGSQTLCKLNFMKYFHNTFQNAFTNLCGTSKGSHLSIFLANTWFHSPF